MERVNVREVRDNLRSYLDRAEAGEEIVILRHGKEIARIVPPRSEPRQFPDLTEFRSSIALRGKPASETVIQQRRESRY
jgi:prevent-host-death family protein